MNKDKRNNIKLLGTLNNVDESGIIANANQIYDANEDKSTQDVSKEHKERIKTLETKENSMQTTLENITKTGEASAASNVTYNHSDSKLDATNVQQAIDEVNSISHFAKRGGIVNISTNYNTDHTIETLTLEQAIAKVPSSDRVLGFTMTFLSSKGWRTYQFIGNSIDDWDNDEKWSIYSTGVNIEQNIGKSKVLPISQRGISDNFDTASMNDALPLIGSPTINISNSPNNRSIVVSKGSFKYFNIEIEMTSSEELLPNETIELYVQCTLNNSSNYYNSVCIPFNREGKVLSVKVNASDFNRIAENDNSIIKESVIIQWTNINRNVTLTLTKFKISGDAYDFIKDSYDDNYLSKFQEDTNHQFDTLNKAIGPYIQQGIALNSNPPIIALGNKNGRCLNGYPVKAGERWIYSGSAYWNGIWIKKEDGTIDESLWDGTHLTYTNREIEIPVDGLLYAWGLTSSSSTVPVFSIRKKAGEDIISTTYALKEDISANTNDIIVFKENIRNIPYEDGHFSQNHSFYKSNNKCVNEYPVKAGERYSYFGRAYYSSIFLKKEDGSIIDIIPSSQSVTLSNYIFTITEDGKLCAWGEEHNFILFRVEDKVDSAAYQGKINSEIATEIATLSEDMFTKTRLSDYIPNNVTISPSNVNYRLYLRVPIYLLDEGDVLFVRFKVKGFALPNLYIGSNTFLGVVQFNEDKDEDGFKHSVQFRVPITKEILNLNKIVSGVSVLEVFTQYTPTEEITFGFDEDDTYINKKVGSERTFVNAYEFVNAPIVNTNSEQEYAQRISAKFTKEYYNSVLDRTGKFVVRMQLRSRDNSSNKGAVYFESAKSTGLFPISFVSDGAGGYVTPMYIFDVSRYEIGRDIKITVQWDTPLVSDRYSFEVLEVLEDRISTLEDKISTLENNFNGIRSTLEIPFRGYSSMIPITVKKDGSGDFTTIQDAINSITDASIYKQYDVQVYDDFEITDLKNLYISTGDKNTQNNPTREVALIFTKNWVHIRGMKSCGNRLYIESPKDLASSSFQNIQVIKAQGNVIINNFYVGIKGGRYAIHQESGGSKYHLDYHAHTVYMNLIIEHKGNSSYANGSGWTSICAQANGTTSGLKQTYINCKWISANKTPFYTHTNSNFDEPNEQTMINCSIVCTSKNVKIGDMGQYWGDIGSGQKAIMKFIGCNFANFKYIAGYGGTRGTEQTNDVRQKYGYNGGTEIQGYNNTPMAIVQATKPCLTFNTIDNDKQIDVVGGTAYDLLWKKTWEKIKGTPVNQGFCVGSIRLAYALNWASNSQVFCLPYILGNCKNSPKTLIVKVDEQEYTITFDKNYMTTDDSSYSWNTNPAISNSDVITDINSVAPTIFRASFNSPIQELYTFEDCQEIGMNASTSIISAGKCLKRSSDGYQMWEIAQNGDRIDGIAGSLIIPADYAAGDNAFGRVLLPKKSYFPVSLFGLSNVTTGNMYKAANNGRLVATSDKNEALFIAIDNGYIIGT